jgi:hypothetical protein
VSTGTTVTVGGRELTLTNLDKVLYPGDGEHEPFTKAPTGEREVLARSPDLGVNTTSGLRTSRCI